MINRRPERFQLAATGVAVDTVPAVFTPRVRGQSALPVSGRYHEADADDTFEVF
jgi:hypothetical protein